MSDEAGAALALDVTPATTTACGWSRRQSLQRESASAVRFRCCRRADHLQHHDGLDRRAPPRVMSTPRSVLAPVHVGALLRRRGDDLWPDRHDLGYIIGRGRAGLSISAGSRRHAQLLRAERDADDRYHPVHRLPQRHVPRLASTIAAPSIDRPRGKCPSPKAMNRCDPSLHDQPRTAANALAYLADFQGSPGRERPSREIFRR